MYLIYVFLVLACCCALNTANAVPYHQIQLEEQRNPIKEEEGDNCNGRGVLYSMEEASLLPKKSLCQCFQCYQGPKCEEMIADCALETRVAETTMWQNWFSSHEDDIQTRISSNYHLGYMLSPREFSPQTGKIKTRPSSSFKVPDQVDVISTVLSESIRALHARVGYQLENYTLVLGSGGVQLIDASLYALTQGKNKGKKMHVFAQAPYYPHFRMEAETNPLTAWWQDADHDSSVVFVADEPQEDALIEMVTTPNNPDGKRRKQAAKSPQNVISDQVYSWPHYSAAGSDYASLVEGAEIVLFSLSKLTGYAATRLGWAFVRDKEVADVMSKYIWLQSTAPSVEAQLRSAKVLKAITNSVGTLDDYFVWAKNVLDQRWKVLRALFAGGQSKKYHLEGEDGVPFMWVRCEHENCADDFIKVGIAVDSGDNYGSSSSYVRICMGHHDSTFALLVKRLEQLLLAGDTIPQSDLRRAKETVPRSMYQGPNYEEMVMALNGHLKDKIANPSLLVACEELSLNQLHELQKEMFKARETELQSIYQKAGDVRADAFHESSFSSSYSAMKSRLQQEKEIASNGALHHDILRDAACHRTVMQYAHHLTEPARKSWNLSVPMLPINQHSVNRARALATSSPSLRAAVTMYDNATTCITCHSTGSKTSTLHSSSPAAVAPAAPLWPEAFTVKFGLTTKEMTNVSSQLWYTSELPAMHIHHGKCPPHFFPIMPDIAGNHPCDLHFLSTGLHLVYNHGQACCSLVQSNMTLNLGRKELGGFAYTGNETVTNYYGEEIVAERWSSTEELAPPSGFQIYIDPSTQLDVHYRNGGPYYLEWAMGNWEIGPQDASHFKLPSDLDCNRKCSENMEGKEVAPFHSHILNRT